MALLDQALIIMPKDVDSNIKKSITLMEQGLTLYCLFYFKGKIDECIATFERLELESPGHPDLYYHRGQVKFIAGQYAAAIEDYRKVLEVDSNFIYAYIQLGVALYKNGEMGESERVFRRATAQFATRSEILHYHGEVYADQNQIEKGK